MENRDLLIKIFKLLRLKENLLEILDVLNVLILKDFCWFLDKSKHLNAFHNNWEQLQNVVY